MKRLVFVSILLLVLILSGCGEADETPTPATPAATPTTPAPVQEDEYWLFWRIVLDAGGPPCKLPESSGASAQCLNLVDDINGRYEVRKEVSVWRKSVSDSKWVREFYEELSLNCKVTDGVEWGGDHLIFGPGDYVECDDVALTSLGLPPFEYRNAFKDCGWSTSGGALELCLQSETLLVDANISVLGPGCEPDPGDESCELGLFSYNQSADLADHKLVMTAIMEADTQSLRVSASGDPDDIVTTTAPYVIDANDWYWIGFQTVRLPLTAPSIEFNVDSVDVASQGITPANKFGFTVESTKFYFGNVGPELLKGSSLRIRNLIIDPQDSCVSCFR